MQKAPSAPPPRSATPPDGADRSPGSVIPPRPLRVDQGMITPDAFHKIVEPLLLATAITLALFAIATVFLIVDGRRMKAEEPEE